MKRAIAIGLPIAAISTILLAHDDRDDEALLAKLPHSRHVTSSTIPPNGDLNPYGVAFVPQHFAEGGPLEAGDILVSNFNNSANLQGTGTTIVRIRPDGKQSLFFKSEEAVGLTTALGVVRAGFVFVGNLPTTDGSFNTIGHGSLIVINRFGKKVAELRNEHLLDGPWDLTVLDEGDRADIFVSDVLSGTVTRLKFRFSGDRFEVISKTQIACGYGHRSDPAALVVGPTGLAYDRERDVLFVASTDDNAIFAIRDAKDTKEDRGRGELVINDPEHLHGPLGLVRTPSGHLIVSNGDAVNPSANHPSELEEYSRDGEFLASFRVDSVPGAAFGIALARHEDDLRFAAVDDNTNTLTVWKVEE